MQPKARVHLRRREPYRKSVFDVRFVSKGGLTARRGPKVQRGPNFNFNFGPRSASDHAQPVHMQCIYNLNNIENVKVLPEF